MAEDPASKTEEPTPRRREEAWAEGNIPHSVEITSTAVLLAAVLIAAHRGSETVTALREMMRQSLVAVSAVDVTPGQLIDALRAVAHSASGVLAPVLAATAFAGFAAGIAQVGVGLRPKRIRPKASKISPASGLQRIFSKRGLVELLKAIVKIVLVGWITWLLLRAAEGQLLGLVGAHPREILEVAGGSIGRVMAWSAGALAVIAAFDYAFQRWQHQQSLRMTKTEVKDERRQAEGDPQVRQRVKRIYQELARNRALAAVPTADVVITNPVHVAVALRYVSGEMGAPISPLT